MSAEAQPPPPARSLRDLRWRDRFHVRLSFLNGVVMVVLLGAVGWVVYDLMFTTEFKGLQARIRATAALLARSVDPVRDARVIERHDPGDPAYVELRARFAQAMADDPALTRVYISRAWDPGVTPPTARTLTVMDVWTLGKADRPGEFYDATEVPKMQEGFVGISQEEEIYCEAGAGCSVSGYAPVRTTDGRPWALVGVDVDASHILAIRGRVLAIVAVIVGLVIAVVAVFGFVLGRRIKGPLETIGHAADRIARGDFAVDVPVARRDEFGLMASHFGGIAHSLRERELLRDTFGRYVSPDIARRLLSDKGAGALGGAEREVTVIFSDIEGYSTMAELAPPQEVVALLNTYLGVMNEVIDRFEGCIIEILGDAILAVFNAPNDVPHHAEAGVRCALAMREALGELNERLAGTAAEEVWRRAGKTRLRARTGMHTGRVVAGNIGSRTRMKYGLIGDAVNVAARIEALNKALGTDLLVSEATWLALPPELRARATSRGTHQVKGRTDGVPIYAFEGGR
jgi:adenylate cyclase